MRFSTTNPWPLLDECSPLTQALDQERSNQSIKTQINPLAGNVANRMLSYQLEIPLMPLSSP